MKYLKLISMILILGGTLLGQQPSGLEIIEKTYNRPTSKTMEANLTMVLENSRGVQRIREIKQFTNTLRSFFKEK